MSKQRRAKALGDLSFIETQFPVARMSVESYSERKAVSGQTLTGLGKWWGRKPLVLCRATILGLLLPATDDPAKDRDVFLRLMTMDEDGIRRRRSKNMPAKEIFRRLPPTERARWFETGSTEEVARLKRGLTAEQKEKLQEQVLLSLPYDERMAWTARPEQIDGPSAASWQVINDHLGTSARSLTELVAELGQRRFGHTPRVGDSFCGGGSIPFEAARLGCDTYASDLNPVAALLTWAAINVVGGGPAVAKEVERVQSEVFESVDRQITTWGIEHREPDQETGRRWRADAYLYCVEVTCPECGWRVPLAPSWVVAEKPAVIVRLNPEPDATRFAFEVLTDVSSRELRAAAERGTFKDSALLCPHCSSKTPIRAIRGDGRGSFSDARNLLRAWENRDVVPREGDTFGERLYCVRWVDEWEDEKGRWYERQWAIPTANDLKNELEVLRLLMERFDVWQAKGYIPSRRIEPGSKTDEPIRTRGWTHWHHLFTPRQLLVHGLFSELTSRIEGPSRVPLTLLIGRLADWNSRLSVWLPGNGGGIGGGKNTFLNQAFNTLFNYSARPFRTLGSLSIPAKAAECGGKSQVTACDARVVAVPCDLWITDPPYADAVNYAELSEFYLAWYEKLADDIVHDWGCDSKRALAVTGQEGSFRGAMVDCYRRLAKQMPDHGLQVVMFTHQDAGVWADLALILWAAGLRVTAAWCVATETGPAVGSGNYVQGTVLLVLRKQTSTDSAFLDEIYQEVEVDVRRQLDAMRDLDDARDPSFGDTDYQLAAYAAALRVLTAKRIEDIDVVHELEKVRPRGEVSPVERLIQAAVRIACDHLVPKEVDSHLWKSLSGPERLYLKGLEIESHGEHRSGVYQELARGFGVDEYVPLLASTRANEVRLKTASEFGAKEMEGEGFAGTLVRHALFAVAKTVETDSPRQGLQWLTMERNEYAAERQRLLALFDAIARLAGVASMPHWQKDSQAAALLAGAMRSRQDHV